MTRYVVQISRWYEVRAEDEDEAILLAGEIDDDEDQRNEREPIVNVTDLDEASTIGADQPNERQS